ncbi:hypothetical protein FAZ15_21960 [Sphingobacterium olei]|uniref:Uncharacterized protein n=1 Tax=Sphingobacterium olei TaxID=2571155 RepID=A0A4U0N7T0_9SPHI|nr:hypothetical protein FAZ15_21960 [Sphingobacterium olei]
MGNATGTTININRDKIESTLSSNPGGDRVKLITGTFVHEIGHNLGASHGDPGSIMNQMNMNEISTGTFNYSYPSVNGSGIRAIMGRTNNPNSLESMYLTPREVRRVIQHKDPGAPGALYKVR